MKVNEKFLKHGEDLFKLMDDEDEYESYIKDKIEYIKENYSLLDEYDRDHFINDIIHDFSMFGSFYDLTKLPVLEFIEEYEDDLKSFNGGKVGILFELNNYELAEQYIKRNYEDLKSEFNKKYIAFYHFTSLDEFGPDEFEYEVSALMLYGEEDFKNRELFIVPGSYKANPLTYLLFKYFKNDIIFLYPKGDEGCLKGFYFDLKWKYFKKILVDLERQGDFENLNTIIFEIIYNLKVFTNPNETEDFFEDFSWVEKLFNRIYDITKREKGWVISHFAQYYDFLKPDELHIRKETTPSSALATKALSKEFLANLNYLKCLNKSEWPNNEVYINGLKLFGELLKTYLSSVIKLTPQITRRIFNRVILGSSLFDVLKINNDMSLLHYYRTDEILFLDPSMISYELVDATNPREYLQIKKLYEEILYQKDEEGKSINIDFIVSSIHYNSREDAISTSAYKILDFFGYNRAKKILNSGINITLIDYIAKLKFKEPASKEKFLSIIFSDLKELKNILKKQKDVESFHIVFESLYMSGFKTLTLPQIVKRVENYECYITPNAQKIIDNLLLLNYVSKGSPLANKVNAIKLYDEYRLREYSSIPDIKGEYNNLEYSLVDMHAPEIISNGIGEYIYPSNTLASSCLTPAGKASSCMEHGATNPHGRFFKITINGHVLAYSWVWRAGDILCFDNIEVTSESKFIPNFQNIILRIYKKASEDIINISATSEEKPIKASIVGCNPIDVLAGELSELTSVKSLVKENFKPNNSEKLYLTDSKENQYLLYGTLDDSIQTEDVNPIYKYQRPKVREFADVPYKELISELNSIYFDYCLYASKAYTTLWVNYEYGYLGEDWFIGYKSDGKYDLYYGNPKEETLKEIRQFVDLNNVVVKPRVHIAKDYSSLEYYLSKDNYDIKVSDLKEYLNSLKEEFKDYSQNGYFHGTGGNIKAIGQILMDGAITSSSFGKHYGGGGSNGSHFICVAEIGSSIYDSYSYHEGFIISPDICAFKTAVISVNADVQDLTNSRSVIRPSGGAGECQVLDYISLDSVDCMTITPDHPENIAQILYLQEYTGQDIPLVTRGTFKKLDKNELKRLIKLK